MGGGQAPGAPGLRAQSSVPGSSSATATKSVCPSPQVGRGLRVHLAPPGRGNGVSGFLGAGEGRASLGEPGVWTSQASTCPPRGRRQLSTAEQRCLARCEG